MNVAGADANSLLTTARSVVELSNVVGKGPSWLANSTMELLVNSDPVIVTVVSFEPGGMAAGETDVTIGAGLKTVRFTGTVVCGSIWIVPRYVPGASPEGLIATVSVAGVSVALDDTDSQFASRVAVKVLPDGLLVTEIAWETGAGPPITNWTGSTTGATENGDGGRVSSLTLVTKISLRPPLVA